MNSGFLLREPCPWSMDKIMVLGRAHPLDAQAFGTEGSKLHTGFCEHPVPLCAQGINCLGFGVWGASKRGQGTREIRMGKTEGEKDSILRETTGTGSSLRIPSIMETP